MNANDDKCHLILHFPEEDVAIQREESTIKFSKVKKLLGIPIDYRFRLNTLVETICKIAHGNLNALSRIELPERRVLINAFLKAQFNYYPVIWIFHSRSPN